MRKARYSRGRFFFLNIFSRLMLPFILLLFANLKDAITSTQGGSIQGWLSITLSLAFFYSIYINFLKREKIIRFSRGDLWIAGVIWVLLSAAIHLFVLYGIYGIPLHFVLNSYSFSRLEPWTFTLIGVFLSPRIAAIFAKKWFF